MLRPLTDLLTDAVNAAAAIRRDAESMAARGGLPISEFVSWVNRMQSNFERVKPLLRRDPVEVQAEAVRLYGSEAPADVFAVINTSRASGELVVMTAFSVYNPDNRSAHAIDPTRGVYHERTLTGTDLAPLAVPLAELIAALEPVAGEG